MNKIKQNKITFTFILTAIVIIFSSLTILSLPVLFDYKSKVTIIEKNFYKNFKIYLKSSGKISYKPFPKPHLLVENATINLKKPPVKEPNISIIKIFEDNDPILARKIPPIRFQKIPTVKKVRLIARMKSIPKVLIKSIVTSKPVPEDIEPFKIPIKKINVKNLIF